MTEQATKWFAGVVAASLCIMPLAHAHEDATGKQHALLMGVDLSHFRTLDEQVSPLVYRATRPQLRMPYANDPTDGKHGNFASVYTLGTKPFTPVSYQRLNLGLTYYRDIGKHWDVGAAASFYWLNYRPNRGVTAYDSTLELALTKTFGRND